MKAVAYVVCFVAIQVSCYTIPDEYFTQEDYTCMERVGTDKETLSNSFNPVTMKLEETEMLKQFMYCWEQEMHMIDENGRIIPQSWEKWLVEVAFEFLQKSNHPNRYEISKKAVENCKDVTAPNKFDKTVKIWNCIVPQIPDV
ncbi:hypothetical protein FQR65_LT02129 [Abscondita terminalis]|nr:hypothetical protein FQR65_LT02129 [Abscondita terminalis]